MTAAGEHLATGDAASELNSGNDVAKRVNSTEVTECKERYEAELSQRMKLFAVAAAVVAAVVDAVLGPALTADDLHTPLLHLMKEIRCRQQQRSSVEPH
jgi:hypothetical protein